MITNIQLYLAIGVPFATILTSLVISLLQISGIREDMRGMRADFREDLRALTGKVVEIDNRLTRIEERLEHRP